MLRQPLSTKSTKRIAPTHNRPLTLWTLVFQATGLYRAKSPPAITQTLSVWNGTLSEIKNSLHSTPLPDSLIRPSENPRAAPSTQKAPDRSPAASELPSSAAPAPAGTSRESNATSKNPTPSLSSPNTSYSPSAPKPNSQARSPPRSPPTPAQCPIHSPTQKSAA